jgi:hypothetical protein
LKKNYLCNYWGLGIGDWGLGPIPNPQSPIPNYDNSRDFWIAYIEMAWLKMIENIKMIKMEQDSIKFIKTQKKTGEYDKLREQDEKTKNKKMEVLKIKSVSYQNIYHVFLFLIQIKLF